MTVSIGILTGRRLDLLGKTISSLQAASPPLLTNAYVVAYLNGRDDATDAYLRSLSFVDDYIYIPSDRPEPIGPAVTRLASHVIGRSDYHLHLEDDWLCAASPSDFMTKTQAILDTHPEIGQVRLRSRKEIVMTRHMVTGTPSRWTKTADGVLVSKLHFTFNPSLMRTEDLRGLYPAASEIDAAKNYCKHFKYVAQLDPGVFFHTGGGAASLRQSLGR